MQNSQVAFGEHLLAQDQEELNEDCKALLSSLPKEKGSWVGTSIFQYQGFWHNAWMLQGVLTCQQHYRQANQDDLFLITNPKSGTTWLKALAFATVNRNQYSSFNHPFLTNNPHDLVPFLEINLFNDNQIPDLSSFTSPRLFATHAPYVCLPDSIKHSRCKLIYLGRDPKDTFTSLWHFTNQLTNGASRTDSLHEEFESFCRGVYLFGPFWDHILGYWKESLENPERVLFLKYEEMKAQPRAQLMKLANFLGCPFSEEEEKKGVVDEILKLCSFQNLSNLDVNKNGKNTLFGVDTSNFFRRGEVGDATNLLTPEMIKQCEQIMEEKFRGSGLNFLSPKF